MLNRKPEGLSVEMNPHNHLVGGKPMEAAMNTMRNALMDQHFSTAPAEAPSDRLSNRQMSKTFKALSDETRRRILELLEENQSAVGGIVENFNLSQPTISRHLSILRDANLVIDERQGQSVIYRLNHAELAAAMRRFFQQFRSCEEMLRDLPEAGAPSSSASDEDDSGITS
jgi:DNA-binding transcriptional ArsR family regulator